MLYNIIATTGKFDPLYPRDLDFLQYAKSLGDELVVILYNDFRIVNGIGTGSIVGKNESSRIHDLEILDFVDVVVVSQHGVDFRYEPFTKYEKLKDLSVAYELEQLRPHLFITNSMETFNLNKGHCADMNINIKFSEMGEYENYGTKKTV